MMTDQRVTLGATWGGSNWGIHVSSDVNYNLGDPILVMLVLDHLCLFTKLMLLQTYLVWQV